MNNICIEELEFENAQLKCENVMLKLDGNLLMLDKAFSMYDYVTKYGVDKSFVKVHNTHYELDALVGMIYPCNESFDGFDVDLANYKQVCMEGILESISNAAKWVIKKLKALCSYIRELFNRFLRFYRNRNMYNKRVIEILKNTFIDDGIFFDVVIVSPEAVDKYNEIMKKVEGTSESNGVITVPGLSEEEFSSIKSFIENFTTKNKDQHIEKITIKDNADKDRVLNIADRTTADFEKLILTIGKIIKDNQDKISQYERNMSKLHNELEYKIKYNIDNQTYDKSSVVEDGDDDTEDDTDGRTNRSLVATNNATNKLEKLKSDVNAYKNTVTILSKLLKIILDDTKITESMLKSISTHVKRSGEQSSAASASNTDAEKAVNDIPML